MAGLSPKQQKFADEFLKLSNAGQAARNAGYSKKYAAQNADKLLKNTNVAEYLSAQRKRIADEAIIDQTEMLERLSKFGRGEMTESVATAKGVYDNVPVGAKDVLKVLELIGKYHGSFTENHNINATVGPVQIIDDVPDEEPPTVVDGFKGVDADG